MPGNHVFFDAVAARMVGLTVNKLGITSYFNRAYERDFEKEYPTGDTVRIKYPQRHTIRDGFGYIGVNIDRRYTNVVADQMFGIDLNWDTIEKALQMERSMEEIEENILEPAAAQLAQEIDSRAALFVKQNTNNTVGVLTATPTSLQTYSAARTRIFENAGWEMGKRKITCITPQMMETIIAASNNILALFNPNDVVGRAFKEGVIGRYAGVDWFQSMSLYQHTTGIFTTQLTGTTISTSNQSGNSLNFSATTGDTLKAGDIITIANVNNVNPMTRRSTGRLKQFKVMADITAAASAFTGVQIYPGIVGSGPYQNVDALPQAAAVVLLQPGTTMVDGQAKTGIFGFTMTSDAFALVNIDLPMPKSSAVEVAQKYTDPETGITIGLIRIFDFDTRSWKTRWDCWLGFGQLLGDNCSCLIASLA